MLMWYQPEKLEQLIIHRVCIQMTHADSADAADERPQGCQEDPRSGGAALLIHVPE